MQLKGNALGSKAAASAYFSIVTASACDKIMFLCRFQSSELAF
jgi:hypothetical protein